MDVTLGAEEDVPGGRVSISNGVTPDGDCCDECAWIKRDNVSVEPEGGGGAIAGDGMEEGVWNGKEEGDISVEEGSDDGRFSDREAYGCNF